jgi:hypothetical protein
VSALASATRPGREWGAGATRCARTSRSAAGATRRPRTSRPSATLAAWSSWRKRTGWRKGSVSTLSRVVSATARISRGARSSSAAGHRRRVNKRPLVVVRASLVEPDGNVRALARDADDAAHCGSWRGRAAERVATPAERRSRWRRLTSSGCTLISRCAGLSLRLSERHEVFVRNRVLVLLPQEFLLDEHVERRGVGAGELPLEHADRVRDLLAAEDQLLFLLTLDHLLPDGHDNGHHHGHDSDTDNQGSHGVAGLRAPSRPATPFTLTS